MSLGALLALLAACAEPPEPAPAPTERVYRLVDAGPPEIWQDGDARAYFDGRRLWGDQGEQKVRARWPALGDVLAPCIGDPLLLPPARDPGGFRKLVWGESIRWRVELSGTNRCGISGALALDAGIDHVDPSGLVVGGLPWFAGGAEAARAVLRAELRAEAPRQWATLPLAERILVIHKLERDPDPAAEAVLLSLEGLGDENAIDIRRAIERRKAGVSGD